MQLSDFDYLLPRECIAQEPLNNRSESKLMVVAKQTITHLHFHNLVEYLHAGDVLVMNETKVQAHQIVGRKKTGTPVELILEKQCDEYTGIFHAKTKKPRAGNVLFFKTATGTILQQHKEVCTVRFSEPLTHILKQEGQLPFPPYVKERRAQEHQYQTVYAHKEGSLAAPTAGLHFTPELLRAIQAKGVRIAKVCLHVGFGTFLPIRTHDYTKHQMHPEYVEVTKEAADAINRCQGRLIVVGTTTLKTLETAADEQGVIHPFQGESTLFIYPRYQFKTKTAFMITNFHLPKSTLLLLVSAFASKETLLNAYANAIQNNYRFFSFGDAMLLAREEGR